MISVKADFLNEEQKKLKQSIMENLIDSLFGRIHANLGMLPGEASSDILLSCIIMFARESITNFIRGSNMDNTVEERYALMDYFLSVIRQEIIGKLSNV